MAHPKFILRPKREILNLKYFVDRCSKLAPEVALLALSPNSGNFSFAINPEELTSVQSIFEDELGGGWKIAVAFASRLVIYVAIMAVLVMIVTLIIKLLGHCRGEDSSTSQRAANETNRLLAKEVVPFTYGTCEGDLESGKCCSSPSENLYDGKICVICYDKQRNCFFIPCGHCATCYSCAQRITAEETKSCPVCRRYIRKVRKLFIS
ncbi:hypothetical protein ACH5RR_014011 [Cinchona calisaya]|uniref:RING-type domain-containing protein n=1 Tax=Cinchona calisaya TaxID=153742 RepID=A0ABD3A1S7_9GENT